MSRTFCLWITIGLVAAVSGCKICQSPYDYCGPVYDNGRCGRGACANAPRAGSILSAERQAAYLGGEVIDGQMADGQVFEGQAIEGPITDGQPVQGGLVQGQMGDGQIIDSRIISIQEQPMAPSARQSAPDARPSPAIAPLSPQASRPSKGQWIAK